VDPAVEERTPVERVWFVFLFSTAIGLLFFAYRHLDTVAAGSDRPWLDAFLCEMTGAYSAGLLFFGVRRVVRRYRLDTPRWYRYLPVHALAVVAFSFAATSLMWASRTVLFPLVGLGPYYYGRMPHRYFMELPIQLIGYAAMAVGILAADRARVARERQLRTAQLEAQLSGARLQNLELQLQPHFLFNALNTISAAIYEDPRAADEMLAHLSALLRASLHRPGGGQEVPLREELSALDHYLSLVRARFGDRLQVIVSAEPAALELGVPSLLLQPLVENAVRHGRASRDGRGRIEVRAAREGGWLRLSVRDDGPGGPAPLPGEPGAGLGLAVTADRLRLLYGDHHRFRAEACEDGFLAAVDLPAAAVRAP
jgi:two-component system, LytTR family, sensor kinase